MSNPALEFDDVAFRYPDGEKPVLSQASFEVPEGAFALLVGATGSGKSTLMNMLGCLDVPSSGTYILNGTDV